MKLWRGVGLHNDERLRRDTRRRISSLYIYYIVGEKGASKILSGFLVPGMNQKTAFSHKRRRKPSPPKSKQIFLKKEWCLLITNSGH